MAAPAVRTTGDRTGRCSARSVPAAGALHISDGQFAQRRHETPNTLRRQFNPPHWCCLPYHLWRGFHHPAPQCSKHIARAWAPARKRAAFVWGASASDVNRPHPSAACGGDEGAHFAKARRRVNSRSGAASRERRCVQGRMGAGRRAVRFTMRGGELHRGRSDDAMIVFPSSNHCHSAYVRRKSLHAILHHTFSIRLDDGISLIIFIPSIGSIAHIPTKFRDPIDISVIDLAIYKRRPARGRENNPRDIVLEIAIAPLMQHATTHRIKIIRRDKAKLGTSKIFCTPILVFSAL